MNRTKRILNILEKNLLDFNIKIYDDSFAHKGHNNFKGVGETHVIVELVSPAFIHFSCFVILLGSS